MVVTIETVVVGKGSRVSQKGNQYNVVTFMDGADTINAMANASVNFDEVETLAPCELTLNVNLGRYMKVEVLDWKKKLEA